MVDWPHKAESKSYFPPKGTSVLVDTVMVKEMGLIRFELERMKIDWINV